MKKSNTGLVIAGLVVGSLSVGLGATPAVAKPSAASAMISNQASTVGGNSASVLHGVDL